MTISLGQLGRNALRAFCALPVGRLEALDEQVTVAEQRDEHPVDQVCLSDDQAARMCLELLELSCNAHR